MQILNLYNVLKIEFNASPEEIKKAYRKLAQEWHPDKHKGSEEASDKFKVINEAYGILSDRQKKLEYDMRIGLIQRPVAPMRQTIIIRYGGWGSASTFTGTTSFL